MSSFDFEKFDHNFLPPKPSKIIVGMSGGVDSSVSALILKKLGYEVIGLFMKNWDELDENGQCQATKDYEDVVKVCDKIGIPYYSVEFIKEYQENVFKYFLEDYKNGFTPNPDILCNREIKFKVFFDKAKELGADYLATGHYCQNLEMDNHHYLVKGVDTGKDQTYFLYTMKEQVLKNVVFPIGHLQKSEVRKIAAEYDLATKEKKDSTGICFIGERNFKNFLSNYIEFKPGSFQNLDGKEVGTHSGAAFYTIGQRKGLGLGGPGEPWYVVKKDMENNIVFVERGKNHPSLYYDYLGLKELSFVNDSLSPQDLEDIQKLNAKVRYRQKDQACSSVNMMEDGILKVEFEDPQRAITIGQSSVFYQNINGHEVCLGGGRTISVGPSYFDQKKSLP